MKDKIQLNRNNLFIILLACAFFCFLTSYSLAVTSKITRHITSADMLKGEAEDVVIGSLGTIQLGRASETLAEEFEDVWSINTVILNGAAIFIGTSPNGGIYRYSLGKLTKIYPTEAKKNKDTESDTDVNDVNDSAGQTVESQQYLTNEHIFAMATDVSGRLLVGISGQKCRLCRLQAGKLETIFEPEPNDAKYIFAIVLDDGGDIYLGTGPEGKVYKLDSFGKKPQLIYDSIDKNILSLTTGKDGSIYAGSDSRGLVYKIDPRTKTAKVLYDSEQQEITALLFSDKGDLFAAATSAKIKKAEADFAAQLPLAGRPEPSKKAKSAGKSDGDLQLKIANTKKKGDGKPSKEKKPPRKLPSPDKASYIYKITKDGFVTDIFSKAVVLFSLAEQKQNLLVGTGNSAQLFSIEPEIEEEAIIYEDKQASQITAVVANGTDVYIATANPAKLIKLSDGFTTEGTFTSELIDAGQPAKWGKLQIEAEIPKDCKIMVASRSGNVKDVNDPTFSTWTKPIEVTEPIQLRCPHGRFCQYKLVLRSKDVRQSPLVREIAVAHTVPNLAPKVEEVTVNRLDSAGKKGLFKIKYKTKDDNDDILIYKIDFRKLRWPNWIELEDKVEKNSFQWDGKTVEDGRYELRVTASDERSNTTETSLTGTRISESVVVDNTGPVIKKHSVTKDGQNVTLKLQASDELSAIGQLQYTIDSNADWVSTIPDDLVYDTTEENFTIAVEDLKAGEHIITIKVSDDVGNKTYKTFETKIEKSKQKKTKKGKFLNF